MLFSVSHFSVFIKSLVEKLPDDLEPMLKSLHLEDIKFQESGHSTSHFTSKNKSDKEFLSELREDQIERLQEIYKLDYLLFDGIYSFQKL